MDPLNIARAATGASTLAHDVGDQIFELWQDISEAGKEYETVSREVSQLGTCWTMLRLSLQKTSCAPTDYVLRPLHRIIYDTNAILNDLQHNLNQFRNSTGRHERVIGGGFLKFVSSRENERRRRLQRFVRQHRICLQRSQIVYAKTVIDIVNAVIQYAQPQEAAQIPARQMNSEDSLIREANRARRRARDLERDPEDWPVTVECWIHALPSRPEGHRSPFDILADCWTRPVPPVPPAGRFGNDQAQAIQNLEQRTAALQQQVLNLNHNVAQYRRAREEDQRKIAQLEAEVAAQGIEMQALQEECAKLDREKKAATKDMITLQTALTRVERERDEAREELEELKATMRPPNAFRWKAPKSKFNRTSGSSSSGRTYVDPSGSLDHGSSRESSRDSHRGSFRDDRENSSRDGHRSSLRGDPWEGVGDGRRGSTPDDRTESSSNNRRESLRDNRRENPSYGRSDSSKYAGEQNPSRSRRGSSRDSREGYPSRSRRGSSRDSREEYPSERRGGSSRDSQMNDDPSREDDDLRYYRQPVYGHQGGGGNHVDWEARRPAFV